MATMRKILIAVMAMGMVTLSDACGRDFEAESGIIQSPNFPGDYPNGLNCVWRIFNADPGQLIVVTFVHFDVEPHNGCQFDSVSVFSEEMSEQNLIGAYCGTDPPEPIISYGSPVIIQLRTDDDTAHTGFNLTFVSDDCGRDYEVESGSIHSPNFPGDYPNGLNCVWQIFNADPGHPIVVTFVHLDVEPTDDCQFDSVSVFSEEMSEQNLIGAYCGTDPPEPIISYVSPLIIQLRTDSDTGYPGFNLTFVSGEIPPGDNQNNGADDCGRDFEVESGSIQSPNFPGDYPNDLICVWRIFNADPGHPIVVTFVHFDVEPHNGCQFDSVSVFSEEMSEQNLIGAYCGTDPPEPIISYVSPLIIQLRTDSDVGHTGFNLTFVVEEIPPGNNQNDGAEEIPPGDNKNNGAAGHCNCSIHGDPHVKINQGKPYLLPIPCAHKVAHLQTPPGDGSCDLQINGVAEFAHPDDLSGACYETLIHIRLEFGDKVFTFIFSKHQNLTFSHTGNLEQDDVTIDPCGPEFCNVNIEKCGMTFTYEASKHSFKMSVPMGIVDNEGICGTCDGKVGGSSNPSKEMILNNTLDSLYLYSPIDNSSINTNPICNSLFEVLQTCDAPYAREMCAPLAIAQDVRRCVRPQLAAPKTLLVNYYDCLETACVDVDRGNCHRTYNAFFLGCADKHVNRNCG